MYKLRDWIEPKKISWMYLAENTHFCAMELLSELPTRLYIDWYWLSMNPSAIELLETNPDKINWEMLSQNPNAIHLLKQNPHNINWECLSNNPSAMELITLYTDKIHLLD